MWISDLVLVLGVIALVAIAMTGVVWVDNRLDRDRPGGTGGGGAANGGVAPPSGARHRRLPPDVRGSR